MKYKLIVVFLILGSAMAAQDLSYRDYLKIEIGNIRHYEHSKSFIYPRHKLVLNLEQELGMINIDDARRHYLGDEVAKRIFLLEKIYTVKSKASPGSFSGKIIIEKPVIYNSIRRLEKQTSQQVKTGKISREAGACIFIRYLNIALELFYEETTDFEEALKKADSTEELTSVYNMVVFQ